MKQMDESNKSFEDIKHIDENGIEFWYARELMKVLEYNKWENFEKVIKKATTACEKTGMSVTDHFPDVRKMVQIGLGVEKKKKDYKLTRYACYIIIQNADSRKKAVALAKTYIVT